MRLPRLFALVFCALSLLAAPVRALDLPGLSGDANAYQEKLLEKAPPQENPTARDAALNRARTAVAEKKWAAAVTAFEQAIQQGDRGVPTWLALSDAFERVGGPANTEKALQAAYLGFQAAVEAKDNGATLARMGRLLEEKLNRPTQALEAYKEALSQSPDIPGLGEKVFALRRAIGLQLKAVRVDTESEPAGACIDFGDELSQRRDIRFEDFVRLDPPASVVVDRRGESLCISGLEYGKSYGLELREGLPGADGLVLKKSEQQTLRVGNRKPSVMIPGKAFILPPIGDGLPVVSVNVDDIAVKLYRINDRNLIRSINEHELMTSLAEYSAEQIADEKGELVWEGRMKVEQPRRNRQVRTAFPIGRVLDRKRPGIYVATAKPADGIPDSDSWSLATQWVIVSDIGLTTLAGRDGLHVFARSLETTQPIAGASLALMARNNEELSRAATDADGHVRFDPGLLRAKGGNAPAAVLAYGDNGDFMLLDLSTAAFDLSDRGVSGRASPGPLDAFLYTDRGVYRPGETVHVGSLLRDDGVTAVENMPMTLRVLRPNGTVFRTVVVKGETAGGSVADIVLANTAPLGTWKVEARVDPQAAPIGQLGFQVEEFVPERLAVELAAGAPLLTVAKPVDVTATSRFLYGPPAAGLDGTAEMVIGTDPNPYPAFAGYRFGLAQESFASRLTQIPFPQTDDKGVSKVALRLPTAPDTTLPLRATVRVAVSEPGGRPTRESLSLPVRIHPFMIGIKPRADERVEEDQEAAFEVIALDQAGARVASPELKYELIEERVSYQLVSQSGSARYEVVTRDNRRKSGTVAVAADKPATIVERVGYGRYRLEIFDAKTGVASSVRFSAGWQVSADPGDRPDRADVTVERATYAPGDTAKVAIAAPFAGEALVTVATDRVHSYRLVSVPKEGTTIEIPVTADWGAGAYVTATVFRPLVKDQPRAAVRALGLAWIGIDPASRSLAVEIGAPDRVRPRQKLAVPIRIASAAPDSQIFLTLAAVDEGILQLTDFVTPDPKAHFLGKRRLALDIRDDYGRLIEWTGSPVGTIRQGGDAAGLGRGLPVVPTKSVALFAGPVRLDASGYALVELDLPDFNGQLRLMAVAYDKSRVGSAEAKVTVRDDVVADAILPRFLAPGDESRLTLSLHNVGGEPGAYRIALTTEGPVAVDAAGPLSETLASGERKTIPVGLRGTGAGIGRVALRATGPGGFDVSHDWQITVRPARPTDTLFTTQQLPPGGVFRADSRLLAPFVPGTAGVSLSYGTSPRIDVPGLLQALDRWAYGCLEQTTSRAFPLLESVSAEALRRNDQQSVDRAADVDRAIVRILDMQRYDGAFGLWGPRDEDAWVSAYAMDFLTRAKQAGNTVPDAPYRAGLQWLRDSVDQGGGEAPELAARAYAHYVLALSDTARMAQLRYFSDAFLIDLPTPLSKGQIGAALARMGDRSRAEAAFGLALEGLARKPWTADYGSTVRDGAALIVLVNEAGMMRDQIAKLIDQLPVGQNVADKTSTQEQAWMVRAAFSLQRPGSDVALTVNERRVASADPTFIVPLLRDLDPGLAVRNAGQGALWQGLTVYGVPAVPQPAARNGFRISRKFLNRDGTPTNLDLVKRNDVFVVLLEGEASTQLDHQALIEHALPAGWEIENARLGAGGVGDLPWIGELTEPRAIEARDDRFVAAVDLTPDANKFRLAFIVRAVTPGKYELPGGHVEDMYKPGFFARQAVARITIQP